MVLTQHQRFISLHADVWFCAVDVEAHGMKPDGNESLFKSGSGFSCLFSSADC